MDDKVRKRSPDTIFMLILILIIMALEVTGGVIIYSAHVIEERCSVKTEGVLLEWSRWIRKNNNTYSPLVEYRVGEDTYTGYSNVRSNKFTVKAGEPVTIYYNPSNPYEFYMEGYDLEAIRSLGGCFMLWGAAAVVLKLIFFVLNRMDMDEKKRIRVKEIVFVLLFLMVFYWMVISIAGVEMAVIMTVIVAPFSLYVKYKNRHRHQKDD